MSYHDKEALSGKLKVTAARKVLKRIKASLPSIECCKTAPAFCGTGVSGVSCATTLAILSGWEWFFIRKAGDNRNHGSPGMDSLFQLKYPFDKPIILVDDFYATGATLRKMMKKLDSYKHNIIGVALLYHDARKGDFVDPLGIRGMYWWTPYWTLRIK